MFLQVMNTMIGIHTFITYCLAPPYTNICVRI